MAPTSSAAAAIPQGHAASRRQWDHKQLAAQWVTTDRGPALNEKVWILGAAVAGAVVLLALAYWLKSGPAPDIREAAVPAPRVIQPAAPAASANTEADAKLQKMRDEQVAFLSRLAAAIDEQQKREAAGDAAAKKKVVVPPPAAPAPAKMEPAAAAPAPAQQAPQQVASIAKPSAAPASAPATTAPNAAGAACKLKVAELSASRTLTYDAIAGMRGAKKDPATGVVRLPPVDMEGRSVVLDVRPDGCVEIVRSSRIH